LTVLWGKSPIVFVFLKEGKERLAVGIRNNHDFIFGKKVSFPSTFVQDFRTLLGASLLKWQIFRLRREL
jgi:hypothetical protein